MTDDTRLDAQVRRALSTVPAPGQDDTRAALLAVLERSGGGGRDRATTMRRWGAPVAAAAAVGVVATAVTIGAQVARGPDPEPPVTAPETVTGTWRRDVPATVPGRLAGRWTMTLSPDGVLALTGPAGAPSAEGASYETNDRQLRVDAFINNVCGELPPGTYEWSDADGGLSLTRLDDPCGPRSDLFVGTWRRVP